MAGPTVTAIIEAQDKATPQIEAFLHRVEGAVKTAGTTAGGVAKTTVDTHTKALDTLGSRYRAFYNEVNVAAAGFAATSGATLLHHIADVGSKMEAEQRKIMSFTDTTAEQMDRIRKMVDTTSANIKGGPEAAMEAVRAGALSGVQAENVAAGLDVISLHATETNESMEHSAEALIGLANMLGTFKDEVGRVTTAGAATRDQFVHGLREAENVGIAANMVAPGSLREQVEAIKVDAPAAQSLGVDRADLLALNARMAEVGVGGSHGAQYIKSAMARLAAPTAAFRSAIAEQGLRLADYQHVNTDLLNETGVDAGLSQALGPLNAKMKAAVHRLVDQFKADANQENFQSGLTDAIRTEGGKKSPVIASNIAERVLSPSVTGIDLVKLLDDIAAKGGGTGALIQLFGKEVGGAIGKLLDPELDRLRAKFRESLNEDHITHALQENADSYTTAVNGLGNAMKGLEDRLFVGLKPAIEATAPPITSLIEGLAKAPDGIHQWMDAVLVGGTAIGALKTGGTLATWAVNLGKVTGVVEEAGPILGTLAGLAAIDFLPATLGIAALAGGVEAFMHRAELFHKFDLWQHGDVDAPKTPDDANALRDRAAQLRGNIAGRQEHLADNLPFDPQLDTLQRHVQERINEYRSYIDGTPEVRTALAARDAAGRELPTHDPAYFAARDHATELHQQFAKRENMAAHDRYIQAIEHVMQAKAAEDPSAGDMVLSGLRAQRDTLQRDLKPGEAASAEIKALNAQIVARMQENQARIDAAVEAERKLREQALDAMGAPKVTQADVDKADADKVAALDAAKAKQEEDRRRAQAEVDRARAAAERAIADKPDVREAQAAANARRDVVAANAARADGRDAEIATMRHELENITGKLSIFDHAYAMSHPAFTRPGAGFNPATGMPEGLGFDPNASTPRTGPAFDLAGPVAPRLAPILDPRPAIPAPPTVPAIPDLRAALAGVTVKSDPVTGTITGSAEVATTIAVKVETGPELRGAIATARYLANIHMSGKMGDEFGGQFGIHRPPPSGMGI